MKTRTEPVDDHQATLEDLLSRWHHHCKGFSVVQRRGADPTFRQALRAKGEQTLDAISEDQAHKNDMESMDAAILGDKQWQGGMEEPHLSAIYCLARNCYTGRNVWMSPRLPQEPMERGRVVAEARIMLTRRLRSAGVM